MIDLYIARMNAWLALRCWAVMQSVASWAYSVYQRIEDKAFDQQNEWHECEDDVATAAHIVAQAEVDKAHARSNASLKKSLADMAAWRAKQQDYPARVKRLSGY